VKGCVEKTFPIAVAVGSLLHRSMVTRVARVVDNIPCKALVPVAKLRVTRYRTVLQRLGGATKAIRVMKKSRDSPAGRARGSFQRVVRDFAGEGLFLCLLVIKVAGVVAIHSVTSALAGDS